VGAGYIAVELAGILNALGSETHGQSAADGGDNQIRYSSAQADSGTVKQ